MRDDAAKGIAVALSLEVTVAAIVFAVGRLIGWW